MNRPEGRRPSAFDPQQQNELANAVRIVAEEAGLAILRIYAGDFAVHIKADCSPVTAADDAAEALILDRLARLTPAIPVVAEESVAHGKTPDIGTGPFWLVDPLDGTREFISRNGEFTVNIALIEHALPVLGAVHVPAQSVSFFGSMGAAGGSAFRLAEGERRQIRARVPDADGLVVVASRSHRDADTDRYLAGLKVKSVTAAGSSLKFCLLAAGEADHYPRFGRTMEWDTAAGHAVLRAAGGSVRMLDGHDLLYGKPGFANPPFIARGQ